MPARQVAVLGYMERAFTVGQTKKKPACVVRDRVWHHVFALSLGDNTDSNIDLYYAKENYQVDRGISARGLH